MSETEMLLTGLIGRVEEQHADLLALNRKGRIACVSISYCMEKVEYHVQLALRRKVGIYHVYFERNRKSGIHM